MNDIPPKHVPEDVAAASGNQVSVYQAASNAGAESFPVLKAFQDYIETEREQARKRVVSLSVLFAVIICAVVGGFLATGIYLLRDRARFQDKLFEVAFAPRPPVETPAPVYITPPAPPEGETVRDISKEVIAALQSGIGRQIDGVTEISVQVHEKVSAQESELEKLRLAFDEMKELNEQLKDDVEAMRTNAAQPQPQPTPTAVAAAPEPEPPPAVAAAPIVLPEAPPLKAPPVTPQNVKPPDAPKGMMLTSIPLDTKSTGTIPWRVIIPE